MVCSKAVPIIHHLCVHPIKQQWDVTMDRVGPNFLLLVTIH